MSAHFLLFSGLLGVVLSLVSCDSPDRLRDLIPNDLSVGRTLAHYTEWGTCAVAVYEVDPSSAKVDEIQLKASQYDTTFEEERSKSNRRENEYGPWYHKPVFLSQDRGRAVGNMIAGSECFTSMKSFADVFHRYSFISAGGYFSVSNYGAVAMLIPSDGIIIVVGHD